MTIVDEIRQNRENGAKRLEEEYKAGLMTLARRFCVDESDAEELVNRTLAAVVDGIDKYIEQSAFFGWMCQILSNIHSLDNRRKFNKDVIYPGTVPDVVDEDAREAIYRDVDAVLLREAVDRLPKEARELLTMHYFMDMPVAQIAKILTMPDGTVRSKLYYARKLLAAKLGAFVKKPRAKALLLALALAALAAVGAVGVAAIRSASEPAAEEAEVVFNAKSTEDTEGPLTELTGLPAEGTDPEPAVSSLSSQTPAPNHESRTTNHETNGDSPQWAEAITDDLNTNKEEKAMNSSMAKMTAVRSVAAAAILSAGAALGSDGNLFSMLVKSTWSSGYYGEGTNDSRPADLVFDGNDNTSWLANTSFSARNEYFIGFELRKGARPEWYTITEGSNILGARRPKSFKLYASADGASWAEIDSRSSVSWQSSVLESKTFDIDSAKLEAGVYYRAFKLVMLEPTTAVGSTYAFSIGELDMDIGDLASPNDYDFIDIVATARGSGVASPFTVSSTGEATSSGNSRQLFDGDLTCDSGADSDHNGRALFFASQNPSVTISFNPESFDNRLVFLRQYGFCVSNVVNGSWNISTRMPRAWEVYVSDKETPSDGDWTLVECRTNRSWQTSSEGTIKSDFNVDGFWLVRHVRFDFKASSGDATYIQLGEISLRGLIGPDQQGLRDVSLYETDLVDVHSNGTASSAVTILQRGMEVDPYDLFVAYGTGGTMVTNLLVQGTNFPGRYEAAISGLKLDSNYTLQFLARPSGGGTASGEAVRFATPHDVMASRLPKGYDEVEYIESTDTGHQYIDCGFAPGDVILGFDLDFIGYNVFTKSSNHDTDNRETGYGVYLSSAVKGQNAQILVTSSSGMNGNYTTGLFWYNGSNLHGKLTRGERMSVLLGNGKYTTICGAVTNEQSRSRGKITGPTLSLFASGNGPGNDPDQFAVMRLYSLKIYDDTDTRTLTHEYVPAKRVADGSYGVYDVVADNWCPNGSATPFLAGSAVSDGRLGIASLRAYGPAVRVRLTRSGGAAADIYAAWGAAYGGVDAAEWENTARCGAFADSATEAQVTSPNLDRSSVYIRFYTLDGEWSETIYLPDQPLSFTGFAVYLK